MSDLEQAVLRVLRIFGPLSNHDVAQRLEEHPSRVYRHVQRLQDMGLVETRQQMWDVTVGGREAFAVLLVDPVELFR